MQNERTSRQTESKINYPESFIALAKDVFKDELNKFEELLGAIKNQDDFLVRILIDEKMDSYNINPTGPLTAERADKAMWNLIKYSEANRLFSQYMQLFEELDNEIL